MEETFWNHAYNFRPSLWRRADTRNVSFKDSLRWPIQIINSVDEKIILHLTQLNDGTFEGDSKI